MSDFYSDEKLRQKEFYEIICKLFSKDIQIKNEIGIGRCNPTTQAVAFYAKFYTQIKALRLGGDNLKTYYNLLPPSVVTNVDPQWFFPYPRNCKGVGDFIYKEKLVNDINDPHKLLWKAETKEDGRLIVVKFTHRYNCHAHKLCHDIGKAPKLLYVSSNLCELYMIVMKYVDSWRLCDCDDLKNSECKKIINDIEVAVNNLYAKDIVFADLRNSNILVIKDDDEKYSKCW
ncbi:9701_t:CDS:2 [Funneliformis geosporum]|nr:9701_t:CDS:2 [Funneliformis geosporum]